MRSAIEEETRRLYERYQVEIVEAYNLCPWARPARLSDNTTVSVQTEPLGPGSGAQDALAALTEASTLDSDIVLLIFPLYTGSRVEFERLTAELIQLDAARYRLASPPFALAAFHPSGATQPDGDSANPERLIPYLRRSPDPTLQLVRVTALARVRKGDVEGTQFLDPSQLDLTAFSTPSAKPATRHSLRHRIAAANQQTLVSPAGADLRASLHAILLDRFLTHQRLGLPPCSWEKEFENRAYL